MKRILMTAMVSLIAAGTCAVAQNQSQPGAQATQDMSANSNADKNDAMKQCMARQKVSNSGLTHLQMQTTCRNEAKGKKMSKAGNDLATGPQSGHSQPTQ